MTEHDTIEFINSLPEKGLCGRKKILLPYEEVTEQNILEVLEKALDIHRSNAAQITYLWDYYRSLQDVRFKKKIVRDNINEKVCVNRAGEIVSFWSAFVLEEPIQYISHGGNDEVSKLVNTLNEYMRAADKEACDKSLVDWFLICGVAPRLALRPDENEDDAPFSIYSPDPRKAFVIYQDGYKESPIAGVICGQDENGTDTYDVYTPVYHYLVKNDTVEVLSAHQYGGIPLIEYVGNKARMGAFEPVISILNAINTLESNALDSVKDFVNGFDVFQNCDIEDGTYAELSIGGKAVKIKTVTQGMEAKVYRVSSEINQSGVQTRIDDLTSAYLEICGMPNRNGGSSTSDTGTAVLYRDGWSAAASRAKDIETLFRQSERQFCKIVLNICKTNRVKVPELKDFEPEFLAHKLSNLQSRTQSLCELLNNDMVHPKYAYAAAGVFDDNEAAYRAGMEWKKASDEEKEQLMMKELDLQREYVRRRYTDARREALNSGDGINTSEPQNSGNQ